MNTLLTITSKYLRLVIEPRLLLIVLAGKEHESITELIAVWRSAALSTSSPLVNGFRIRTNSAARFADIQWQSKKLWITLFWRGLLLAFSSETNSKGLARKIASC